jgi:Fe2+ transport system protein FeoA
MLLRFYLKMTAAARILPQPFPSPPTLRLSASEPGRRYVVAAIDGDDAIAHRLLASGVWVGAHIERIAQAPFGDPLLFRVHGFRLALRASEAARVRIVEARS